jgi:hypothetical protein
MRELNTEIEINSSPERVWELLTDFKQYPRWNPFIRSVRGKLEPEAKLEVRIQPSGARGMTFRPAVLKAERTRELRWLGRLLIPGIFDGEHIFTIEPIAENSVRFVQREQFSGLLVPLLWRSLNRDTRRGFVEMNAALKKRAESAEDVRFS